MKRIRIIGILLICLLLSGCSLLQKQAKELSFSLPSESTVTIYGEKTKYQFVQDKIIQREDGLFEVYCTRIDETTEEEVTIRYLFSPDGTPIGSRDYSTSQDTIDLFDTSFAAYKASIEREIDYIKENRIYTEDGGYTDFELEGDRIIRVQTCSEDGDKIVDYQLNEFGQTEALTVYDENGEAYIKIRITYEMIPLEQ